MKKYKFNTHLCVDGQFSQIDAIAEIEADSLEEAKEKLLRCEGTFEYDYDSIDPDSMTVNDVLEVYEDSIEEVGETRKDSAIDTLKSVLDELVYLNDRGIELSSQISRLGEAIDKL